MADYKEFTENIKEEIEKTFKSILAQKYIPLCGDGKTEVIKLQDFEYALNKLFQDLNYLYESNDSDQLQKVNNYLYLQKIQIILIHLYEDVKQNVYKVFFVSLREVVDAEFVKTSMDKALRKIKIKYKKSYII